MAGGYLTLEKRDRRNHDRTVSVWIQLEHQFLELNPCLADTHTPDFPARKRTFFFFFTRWRKQQRMHKRFSPSIPLCWKFCQAFSFLATRKNGRGAQPNSHRDRAGHENAPRELFA